MIAFCEPTEHKSRGGLVYGQFSQKKMNLLIHNTILDT